MEEQRDENPIIPDDDDQFFAWFSGETATSEIKVADVCLSKSIAHIGSTYLEWNGRRYDNADDIFLYLLCGRRCLNDEDLIIDVWADEAHPEAVVYTHDNQIFTATELSEQYRAPHLHAIDMTDDILEDGNNGTH